MLADLMPISIRLNESNLSHRCYSFFFYPVRPDWFGEIAF